MISRRDFLKGVSGAAAAAAAIHPLMAWAADGSQLAIPGEDGLILRSARFLDLEMPPEFIDSWITPVPRFFVRNHMHEPSTLDAETWELKISGEVERPLSLTFADLVRMEPHSVTNTLECAGNGRAFYHPHLPGVQWQKGAVGTARFSGPRLQVLLQRAGVKPSGKHVMFRGLDEVPGKVPPFIRSIPIEKANHEDTLIAMRMNGEALTKHHGFPARSLVPGWVGSASCKWLSEIKVLEKEFDGNFMRPGYRMPNHPLKPGDPLNLEDSHALTALTVKSVIAGPINDSTSKSRSIHIHGAAWAGETDIVKLEVSTDSGATWQPAQLGRERARYAWRLWSYNWKAPRAGDYTIWSRATDSQGRIQPQLADWNPGGYLYNAFDQVKIHVES
ncbi:MAG: sulfite oxidase [Terriglobales bacterium]